MSDAADKVVDSSDAAEVNARAAALLRRCNLGNWTEVDEAELNAWLAASPAHRIAYWRLRAAWDRMDRLAALQGSTRLPESAGAKAMPPFWLRAAAVFIAAAMLAGGTGFWLMQPREKIYSTALGERETIALADGSRIELNTNTEVRLSADAQSRTVSLERGEAYFQIHHDAKRLFVVMAGNHRIIDVGTKFLVRRDGYHLEVALVEGRARFDMPDARSQLRSMPLAAGDVIVATAKSTTLTRQPIQKLSDQLGWRRGTLVFKHTTLADAAAEFNRYNPEKIIVAEDSSARLTINGTFRTNDIAAFTDAAHVVFGLRVVVGDGEITISR